MIVYVDVVCLENFVVNFILLSVVDFFLKVKGSAWRLALAAFFGSLVAVFSVVVRLSLIYSILFKVVVSVLMVMVAFGGTRDLRRRIVFFYLITFVFGGVCLAFVYFGNYGGMFISNGVLMGDYSLFKFFVGVFFAICFCRLVCFFFMSRQERKELICDLEIGIDEKICRLKVLMDTGNLLREPCTGKPVVIVEKDCLVKALGVDFLGEMEIGGDLKRRFYVVPYSSLGNDSGVLVGVSCDFVRVFWEDEVLIEDVVIGLYDKRICSSSKYRGLIGMELLNEKSCLKV